MWQLVVVDGRLWLLNKALDQKINMGRQSSKINRANAEYELARRVKDPTITSHDYESKYTRYLIRYAAKKIKDYIDRYFSRNKDELFEHGYNVMVDTFLSVCRTYEYDHPKKMSFHSYFLTFAMKNVKSSVYTKYKKRKAKVTPAVITDGLLSKALWTSFAVNKQHSVIKNFLEKLPLDKLTDRQRRALLDKFIEGKTFKAMALQEKICNAAVRLRVMKGILNLRRRVIAISKKKIADFIEQT